MIGISQAGENVVFWFLVLCWIMLFVLFVLGVLAVCDVSDLFI